MLAEDIKNCAGQGKHLAGGKHLSIVLVFRQIPPDISAFRLTLGNTTVGHWAFDNPKILAGTAELLAPHSGQLTSRLAYHWIADVASFPARKSSEKAGSVRHLVLFRRQVSGGAAKKIPKRFGNLSRHLSRWAGWNWCAIYTHRLVYPAEDLLETSRSAGTLALKQ